MKITQLRHSIDSVEAAPSIRTTAGQDTEVTSAAPAWYRRRVVWIAGGAGILLVLLTVWLLSMWSRSTHTVSADRLRVATVTRAAFTRDAAADGVVIAAVSPTVFASAAGTVVYEARAGQRVTKGQLLAKVDSPDLLNEFQRQRATLQELEATLEKNELEARFQSATAGQRAEDASLRIQAAERDSARAEAAWNQRVISQQDYERARDNAASAKISFEEARDAAAFERQRVNIDLRVRRAQHERQALVVASLQKRVDQLSVRSPVDGMVASLALTDGARVAEGGPVITVVDLSAFEVEFQLAEAYARDVRPGMASEVLLDGRTVPGVVNTISPEVREGQVRGRVEFTTEQPAGLRQNQRASVRIIMDHRPDVLQFERGAFVDEYTREIYVLRGDRAIRTPVKLGKSSIGAIEVVQGLQSGDRVVISDMRDYGGAPELFITR